MDPAIGVYIIDRYTYYALNFLEKVEPSSAKTLGEFVSTLPLAILASDLTLPCQYFSKDTGFVFPVESMSEGLLPVYSGCEKRSV